MSPKELDEYIEVIAVWVLIVVFILWLFGAFS